MRRRVLRLWTNFRRWLSQGRRSSGWADDSLGIAFEEWALHRRSNWPERPRLVPKKLSETGATRSALFGCDSITWKRVGPALQPVSQRIAQPPLIALYTKDPIANGDGLNTAIRRDTLQGNFSL